MNQFAAQCGFQVVKAGQQARLEVGVKMPRVQRQVRAGGQQFLAIGLFGFVAQPLRPFLRLRGAGAGLRHQLLAGFAAFAQQPRALRQIVGLQHKLALFKQSGLKALDLVQKNNQVQRNVAHQPELGADARQLGVAGVPHLHKLVLQVHVKFAAQKFAQLRMHKKVAGVFAHKTPHIAGQQHRVQLGRRFGGLEVKARQPGVDDALLQIGALGGGAGVFCE